MLDQISPLTVGQSLQRLGLETDPFVSAMSAGNWWFFEILGVRLYCYNFAWRRRAIAYHDLHHAVTGYPCTMKGEMQVATWEFAAGSFPNIFAKLFCLPLVAMGAILIPRKILSAYRQGRRSKSLFLLNLDSDVINMPLEKLKALTANHTNEVSLLRDVLGYTALVGASLLMYLLPIVSGVLVFLQVMG